MFDALFSNGKKSFDKLAVFGRLNFVLISHDNWKLVARPRAVEVVFLQTPRKGFGKEQFQPFSIVRNWDLALPPGPLWTTLGCRNEILDESKFRRDMLLITPFICESFKVFFSK